MSAPRRAGWIGCVVLLGSLLGVGPAPAAGPEGLLGPRLLHYPLRCEKGNRCQIECFQAGRSIITGASVEADDAVTLVFTDGFSDRLEPLWIEVRAGGGRDVRTILLPRDTLCDLQGLTIPPLAPLAPN